MRLALTNARAALAPFRMWPGPCLLVAVWLLMSGSQQVERTSAPTGTTTITTTPSYDPDGNVVSQTSLTTDSTAPGVTQTHAYTTAYNSLDQPTSSSDDGLSAPSASTRPGARARWPPWAASPPSP